jgi:hypothetical protein
MADRVSDNKKHPVVVIPNPLDMKLLFILTANAFVPGGSGTTIIHITQNNTPHSNKTQHTKLQKQ